MPCSSGETPVIIVVQTNGERGGLSVFRAPVFPPLANAARLGITPDAIKSSSISQSAPSSPTKITGCAASTALAISGAGGGAAPALRGGAGFFWQARRVASRASRAERRRMRRMGS